MTQVTITGTVTATHLTYNCPISTSNFTNGDFETGDLTGWNSSYGGTVSPVAKRSGNYGLLLTSTGSGLSKYSSDADVPFHTLQLSWCDFSSMDIWYKIPYISAPDPYTFFRIRIQYKGAPE